MGLGLPSASLAQDTGRGALPDTYFGTVRARDMSSLSYGGRGCIVEVSQTAKRGSMVEAGQLLVRLDAQRMQLALRTADGRLSELAAAVAERELAIAAAVADERRRGQELAFVEEEFQRNSVMLGRGLINETAMEAIERRHMEATFASERAKEAIANAEAALKRAEIALEIGELEKQSAELDLSDMVVAAPFDGVLVGFSANVGDCVQEGEVAAQIYVPDQKAVDVFFPISRLTQPVANGLGIGAEVTIRRVNGQECPGSITQLESEADPETQYVEATVDVDESCAPNLFLNEGVEVRANPGT